MEALLERYFFSLLAVGFLQLKILSVIGRCIFFLNACAFHICEIIRFVCSLDMSDKFFGKTRLNHAPDHFRAVVHQW